MKHHQLMGNLPAARFAEGQRAFYHCGVDFAGSFICRESARRKSPLHKAYICLFVCFSSKAIHLEVVPNLSTEGFLDALDRFHARMFSDNGTNFVDAAKYLAEVKTWIEDIVNHCAPQGIDWSLFPPHAPNFGGLWEAGVMKAQLHKS